MADKKPSEKKPTTKLAPELSWLSHEKDQAWVPRFSETWENGRVIKKESAIWRYCVSRHKQRWKGTKREKGPPTNYSEGKGIGWWFPKLWKNEFKPPVAIRGTVAPLRARRSADLSFSLTGFSLAKLQSWRCPTGTIFDAYHQTVTYPDGAVETWEAVERRQGGLAGEPPASKDEDEPPPPSYI